jgi:DNA-binding transcriptional LysR family regulator
MDQLDSMRVFVVVSEQRSFAAAARQLALSPARVTRAVASLEERCGTKLLHRTTRVVRLTEAGAGYLLSCRRILSDLREADAQAGATQTKLTGQVSITAPMLFGRKHVGPLALSFLKRHPGVTLRMVFSDSVLDLFEQNIDVAIRIAQLPDSSLVATRVGSVRRVVCASPGYLRQHGVPRHPDDVRHHQVIGFTGMGEPKAWSFVVDGKLSRVQTTPRLIVNSADLEIQAASLGHGLTKVLSYQITDELRDKRLRIVLAPFEQPPIPIHIVSTEGKQAAARVRAFVEYAAQGLRAQLGG